MNEQVLRDKATEMRAQHAEDVAVRKAAIEAEQKERHEKTAAAKQAAMDMLKRAEEEQQRLAVESVIEEPVSTEASDEAALAVDEALELANEHVEDESASEHADTDPPPVIPAD